MPTSELEWTSLDTGDDSEEWQKILRLVEEQDLDWAYWSIDGYKYPGTTKKLGCVSSQLIVIDQTN